VKPGEIMSIKTCMKHISGITNIKKSAYLIFPTACLHYDTNRTGFSGLQFIGYTVISSHPKQGVI